MLQYTEAPAQWLTTSSHTHWPTLPTSRTTQLVPKSLCPWLPSWGLLALELPVCDVSPMTLREGEVVVLGPQDKWSRD